MGVLEQEGEVSGYLGNKKNKEKVYILLTGFKLNSSFSFVILFLNKSANNLQIL